MIHILSDNKSLILLKRTLSHLEISINKLGRQSTGLKGLEHLFSAKKKNLSKSIAGDKPSRMVDKETKDQNMSHNKSITSEIKYPVDQQTQVCSI